MTETPRDDKPKPARRPRIKLPFDNRREDVGSWTYDHRIGLCVTLIAYLALMIVFVSSKIVVGRRTHQQGMYIDLQTLAEMEQERDRLEREVRERQRQEEIDWRSIRNQASNENALNEKLRDDRGTNAAALNEAAAEAEARMRANREAYEQGLAEERAIRERRGKEDGAERQDRKVKGRVTVSFSIADPVRTSRYLEVPAYLCEGGGDVTVSVTVDRAGKVTGARVTEGGDDCMRESALRAARNSLFNIDNSAPARQTGTITYIFIPQWFPMIAACLPHILGHIQSDLTGHLERCPFGILPLVGRQSTAVGSRGRRFPAKRRPFWGGSVSGKSAFFMDNFGFGRGFVRKKRNFVADVIFRTVRCVNCFSSCWPSRRACSFRRAATVRASGSRRPLRPFRRAICTPTSGSASVRTIRI